MRKNTFLYRNLLLYTKNNISMVLEIIISQFTWIWKQCPEIRFLTSSWRCFISTEVNRETTKKNYLLLLLSLLSILSYWYIDITFTTFTTLTTVTPVTLVPPVNDFTNITTIIRYLYFSPCHHYCLFRLYCHYCNYCHHCNYCNYCHYCHNWEIFEFREILDNWKIFEIRDIWEDLPWWLSHQKVGNFCLALCPHFGLLNHIFSLFNDFIWTYM